VTEQHRVLMVGLGTIAQTHLQVLGQRRDVTLVGGVDPVAQAAVVPVFRSLDDALAADVALTLAVVATPTDTHVRLVRDLVERTDALVLSEKPLATTRAEVDGLADVADRVRVAHHFAFSPEVEWALRFTLAAGWTRPNRVLSVFNDAYAGLGEARLASYVSTWVDSAPNQLSLLAPFVGSCEVVGHSDERFRAVTVLDHEGGRSVLASNWLAADTPRSRRRWSTPATGRCGWITPRSPRPSSRTAWSPGTSGTTGRRVARRRTTGGCTTYCSRTPGTPGSAYRSPPR